MKSWQINRKVKGLSSRIDDSVETETRIDISSLSEPERKLLDKVQEIIDKYAPAKPPQDVIEKNGDLWHKGLDIFAKQAKNCLFTSCSRQFAVTSLRNGTSRFTSTI